MQLPRTMVMVANVAIRTQPRLEGFTRPRLVVAILMTVMALTATLTVVM